MDLKALKAKGGFVSAAPVKKTVTWTRKDENDEELSDTFDVHVRRIAFGDIERIFYDPESGERSRTAALISAAVLLGDSKELMSYEDAYQLDPGLASVLSTAIGEVNGTKAKN